MHVCPINLLLRRKTGQLTKHTLLDLCPRYNYQNKEEGGLLSLQASVLSGVGSATPIFPELGQVV